MIREGETTENLESHRSDRSNRSNRSNKKVVLLRKTDYIFNLLLVKTDEELMWKETEKERKRKLNLVRPAPKPGLFQGMKNKILEIARRLTSGRTPEPVMRKSKTAQSTVFRRTLHTPTCPSPALPSGIRIEDLPDSQSGIGTVTVTDNEDLTDQQREEEEEYGIRSSIVVPKKKEKKKSTILKSPTIKSPLKVTISTDRKERIIDQSESSVRGLMEEPSSALTNFNLKISAVESSSSKVRSAKFEELLEQIEIPMDSDRIVPPRSYRKTNNEKSSFSYNGSPTSNLVEQQSENSSPPVSPQKVHISLKKVPLFSKNLLTTVKRKNVYQNLVIKANKLNPILETKESAKGDSPMSRERKKTTEGFNSLTDSIE